MKRGNGTIGCIKLGVFVTTTSKILRPLRKPEEGLIQNHVGRSDIKQRLKKSLNDWGNNKHTLRD